jgi:8-oxo-dGTP diphosphatase
MSSSSFKPVTPALTVDAVIALTDRPGSPVVLIERKYPPPGWALPGGFVEIGETVEQAVVREAREETGLEIRRIDLLGVYSDPARDARMHTVSVVFCAEATGTPVGQDDARVAQAFALEALPPLAFDHAKVLADYVRWRTKSGE